MLSTNPVHAEQGSSPALASRSSGGEAALGSIAKSSPPPTGKVIKAARAQRYQALSQSRFWLKPLAKRNPLKAYGWDLHRTQDCRYKRIGLGVTVHFDAKHQTAFYGDVATCGSVWACPVCAAVIQNRRRPEVQHAVDWAYENGYQVTMITFTFPHRAFHRLKGMLNSQAQAFKIFRQGSPWDRFRKRHGLLGFVRSLENTHGQNGWHPHTHELWITKGLTAPLRAEFEAVIRRRWRTSCIKAGLLDETDKAQLFAFDLHSVDVQFDVSTSDYLVKQDNSRKWGVDAEMTAQTSKRLEKGVTPTVHPHEFLIRNQPGDDDRYREYVSGMHGKRQLYWSQGLKDLCGLKDLSDEEIAKEQTEKADLLAHLTDDQWKVVRGNDALAELLDAAESGGWSAMRKLLQSLGCEFLSSDPSDALYDINHVLFQSDN
jgi:hypothetical protein